MAFTLNMSATDGALIQIVSTGFAARNVITRLKEHLAIIILAHNAKEGAPALPLLMVGRWNRLPRASIRRHAAIAYCPSSGWRHTRP